MRRLLAIDPGLANTGLVLFIDGRIVGARTVTTKGKADTDPFGRTVERAARVAREVAEIKRVFDPDLIAIEAYEDFGGKYLREVRRRWTTPMAIAAIALGMPSDRVRWQKASIVMGQYASHIRGWKAKVRIVAGDQLLTNDHHRSAAAHGLYAIAHERFEEARRT